MSLLYTMFIWTVPFIAMLTVIVFFHEMGHFLMGRVFKVKIDAFSIGFGPELLHWIDRHGTRWRLALLPLGGYVKFHGDGDPASMTKTDLAADGPDRGRLMQSQALWKRTLIVAAGPAVNFLLAIVLFAGLFMFYGQMSTPPLVQDLRPGGPAEAAGFKRGDLVIAVDGVPVDSLEAMKRAIEDAAGAPMAFTLRRDGRDVGVTATPRRENAQTIFGPVPTYLLGFVVDARGAHLVRYAPIPALQEGAAQTWRVVAGTGHFIRQLILGHESTQQLSGPVGIAKVTATAAQHGVEYVIELTALVSISIGLLNLLPIPILDGGFLLFFALEALRGRALSPRSMEIGFRVGLSLIATLSVFVFFQDVRSKSPAPAEKPAAAKTK